MEITVADQLRQLFLCCGMGFLLGVYYDVYRVIRLVMKSGKRAIFVEDVLFFVTAAFITFLFSLAVMDGRIRLYLFIGEAVGFFAYYYTIGRIVMRFAESVIAVIIRFWVALWSIIFFPFRLIARLLRLPFTAIYNMIIKILNKLGALFKNNKANIKKTMSNIKNMQGFQKKA